MVRNCAHTDEHVQALLHQPVYTPNAIEEQNNSSNKSGFN